MSYFNQAGIFLVEFILGLLLLAVVLRFLLAVVRADFYNPIAQFLMTVTNPLLRPVRRIVPGLFGIDMASVLLILLIAALKAWLVLWLSLGRPPAMAGLALTTVADLLSLLIYIYLFAMIARALLSWINPYGSPRSPIESLLVRLTEPLLGPVRRRLPASTGIDFSPIVLFLVIGLIQILVLAPLHHLALRLAY